MVYISIGLTNKPENEIEEAYKIRKKPNEYTCRLFKKDYPVFYKAEYASETL